MVSLGGPLLSLHCSYCNLKTKLTLEAKKFNFLSQFATWNINASPQLTSSILFSGLLIRRYTWSDEADNDKQRKRDTGWSSLDEEPAKQKTLELSCRVAQSSLRSVSWRLLHHSPANTRLQQWLISSIHFLPDWFYSIWFKFLSLFLYWIFFLQHTNFFMYIPSFLDKAEQDRQMQ